MSLDVDTVDVTEETPLLHESTGVAPEGKPRFFRLKFASEVSVESGRILLICIAPFIHLSGTIATTTILDVVRKAVCFNWYAINDPNHIPTSGTDPLCEAPSINSWFSAVMVIVVVIQGLGVFASYSFIAKFGGIYGRKPLQVGYLLLDAFGTLLLPLSAFVASRVWQLLMQILWILIGAVASLYIHILLINMILVDTTEQDNRTKWLLIASGVGAFGRAPSFTFGGFITSWTGSPLVVFFIAVALLLTTATCSFLFLPESFGPEKRAQLRQEQEAKRRGTDPAVRHHIVRRILSAVTSPFHVLAKLGPFWDERTKRRNWRLSTIAVSHFLSTFVMMYIPNAKLVYGTTRFHFGPKENGYLLTICTSTQIVCLLLLAPLLLRFLDRLYLPKTPFTVLDSGAVSESEIGTETVNGDEERDAKTSGVSRRDVHVTAGSFFIEAVAQFFMGLAQTGVQFIFTSVILAFSGSGAAAIRSAAASSVSPLQSGEVLSAIEMLSSIAQMLSPLLGVMLTILINTAPAAVFFLSAAITLLASILMLFVRDSDRYRPPS